MFDTVSINSRSQLRCGHTGQLRKKHHQTSSGGKKLTMMKPTIRTMWLEIRWIQIRLSSNTCIKCQDKHQTCGNDL